MRRSQFDPEADRKFASFSQRVREAVRADKRRVVVVGASGWIGRTLIDLLHEALGSEGFAERVVCFGSRANILSLRSGLNVPVRALSDIATLAESPTTLFHLAFLTKDKVAAMSQEAYTQANEHLTRTVLDALERIGVDRLFFASSGAASFADDPNAAADLRLYGRLKRDHEKIFADWGQAAPDRRRVVVARIFNVSGPWINKHDAYALANFIHAALAGRPIEVRAPKRVWRGHVAVRELLSLVFAILLEADGPSFTHFETGGEAMELEQVARCVAGVLGGSVIRAPISQELDNRYVGDSASYSVLLSRHGIAHLGLADQVIETAAYLCSGHGS